tara:strand:- start:1632 stop:1862 length:231 start_codon:yes stop_codon:yes gene_type:complete
MKCLEKCRKTKTPCQKRDCRLWVDYSPDLNCVSETVENHGALTLREVAKRLNVSFVRVKQIEDKALKKLADFANKL